MYADLAREQIERRKGTELASLSTGPAAPPGPAPSSEEQKAWDRIKDTGNPFALREFIRRYPSSVLANVAKLRLEALERAAQGREGGARAEREAKAAEAGGQKG